MASRDRIKALRASTGDNCPYIARFRATCAARYVRQMSRPRKPLFDSDPQGGGIAKELGAMRPDLMAFRVLDAVRDDFKAS